MIVRKIFQRLRKRRLADKGSERSREPKNVLEEGMSSNKDEVYGFEELDEDGEDGSWTTLFHNGPYFESIDEHDSREDMLYFYSKVPLQYRDGIFWSNCPFKPSELSRSVVGRPSIQPSEKMRLAHSVCEIDEKRVSITHWKMETSGVFLGRGEHPLRGKFRRRVIPEDVILNLGEDAPVPRLPRGRRWKDVVHQHGSSWLWSWNDPLTGKMKYVYPHPSSELHVAREIEKFETARSLKQVIKNIRGDYVEILKNWERQSNENLELAVILLLIDRLGIRIGNPGSQTGASTLRGRNILCYPEKKKIRVKFVGKDSINYDQEFRADDFFFQTLRKLRPRSPDDFFFPNTSSKIVNQYLQSIDSKLKAKVFRTYNASEIFQEGLRKKSRREMSQSELVKIFREVNIDVARFCNHRKVGVLHKVMDKYSPSTTIANYIDPRIVYAWAKKFSVPPEQVYSKNLVERFKWANTVDENFIW